MIKSLCLGLALFLLLALASCQPRPATGRLNASTAGLERLAVFGMLPEPEVADRVTEEDLEVMNQAMVDALVKKKYLPIPPGQLQGTRSAILSGQESMEPETLLRKVSQAHQAGALLVGTLYRYRQRMTPGQDPPASVGLTLQMIRVADGKVIWRGSFDQTQQSVLENLLGVSTLFKRGLRWATAQELALLGLSQLMDSFPAVGEEPKKK
jgi:hypothetical protein